MYFTALLQQKIELLLFFNQWLLIINIFHTVVPTIVYTSGYVRCV